MKWNFLALILKKFLYFIKKSFFRIAGNTKKPCTFKPMLEKIKKSTTRKFLIFQETDTPKKIFTFQETEISYISAGNSKAPKIRKSYE